jgi:hypothetical protein
MDSWTRLVHDPDWFPTPAQVSWRSIASKIARRGADHDQPSHSPNNTTSTTSAARLIAQHGELPDKHSRCAYGIDEMPAVTLASWCRFTARSQLSVTMGFSGRLRRGDRAWRAPRGPTATLQRLLHPGTERAAGVTSAAW